MYAILRIGSRQYLAKPGTTMVIDHQSDQSIEQKLVFEDILVACNGSKTWLGSPKISGAVVHATVVAHPRDDKIHIVKFKRRKHQMKWQGHRQKMTTIQIESIDFPESTAA